MINSNPTMKWKWIPGLFVALSLAACNNGKVIQLEQQLDELQTQFEAVVAERDQLQQKVADLEGEIERLRNSDQALYSEAMQLKSTKRYSEAEAVLQKLLQSYPRSSLAARAKQEIGVLRRLIQDQAIAEAGFSLKELRSYWRSSADTLQAQSLLIPEIRFKLVNTSGTPIKDLQIKAVYHIVGDDGSKEKLGEGWKIIAGLSDAPLEEGVSQEVWLPSDTGYVDNGSMNTLNIMLGKAPRTVADLYYRKEMGEWVKFRTMEVKQEFMYR